MIPQQAYTDAKHDDFTDIHSQSSVHTKVGTNQFHSSSVLVHGDVLCFPRMLSIKTKSTLYSIQGFTVETVRMKYDVSQYVSLCSHSLLISSIDFECTVAVITLLLYCLSWRPRDQKIIRSNRQNAREHSARNNTDLFVRIYSYSYS